MRYFLRFSLLMVAFALTTWGLLAWQQLGFKLEGLLPTFDDALRLHPIYLIVLGVALIPPTLWEIFILERETLKDE